MFNFTALTEAQILLFALILMRMSSFVLSSAVLGNPTVNAPVKILLSIVLSMIVFPLVQLKTINMSIISTEIIGLVIREIIVGLALGFLTRLFFFVVSMTGDLVSMSIGLSAAQIYNPMMGSQGGVVEQFYTGLATLIFFGINGHHMLLSGIMQSYDLVTVAGGLNVSPFADVAVFVQTTLEMAIKMAAPILGSLLIVNLAMGILGRAVPQINVLVTSMPVTIMIGFIVMFVCLPLLIVEMNGVVDITAQKLFEVMKQLGS